jgi:hypothetical protein
MGKAKARLSASSILKKINSIKIIFKKWGNTAAKQKLCRGNTVAIHIVFLKIKLQS